MAMEESGSGFLKTVNFGGFDKKDVLTYVDKLNTQIYTLENELNEKKALLENSGGNIEDKEKYEKLLDADKAKITELQASNDNLKLQIQTVQEESAAKDTEIAALKKKLEEMENELIDAKNKAAAANTGESNAMDLANVFMEAQRTASTITTKAKEDARKMDEDAKKLANQVVDDANSKASTIVKTADEKAAKILYDAENRSSEMRTAADNMKAVVLAELTDLAANVNQIKATLEALSKDSVSKITETSELLSKTEETLKKDGIPQFTMPKSAAPAPAARPAAPAPAARPAAPAPVARPAAPAPAAARPAAPAPAPAAARPAAPAPKPAAAPAPAPAPAQPKPTPKLSGNFGFDLSEIEKMAKQIEADAKNNGVN